MRTSYFYPVDLERDEDGRWVARLADFPGYITDGATRAEALTEAADLLEEALAYAILECSAPPAAAPG